MSLDIWLTIQVDTGGEHLKDFELYSANITHNLCPMWSLANVYDPLYMWKGKLAEEAIPLLESGLRDMEKRPEEYRKLNPDNGWGSYNGAVIFLRKFTQACKENPKATIGICK